MRVFKRLVNNIFSRISSTELVDRQSQKDADNNPCDHRDLVLQKYIVSKMKSTPLWSVWSLYFVRFLKTSSFCPYAVLKRNSQTHRSVSTRLLSLPTTAFFFQYYTVPKKKKSFVLHNHHAWFSILFTSFDTLEPLRNYSVGRYLPMRCVHHCSSHWIYYYCCKTSDEWATAFRENRTHSTTLLHTREKKRKLLREISSSSSHSSPSSPYCSFYYHHFFSSLFAPARRIFLLWCLKVSIRVLQLAAHSRSENTTKDILSMALFSRYPGGCGIHFWFPGDRVMWIAGWAPFNTVAMRVSWRL